MTPKTMMRLTTAFAAATTALILYVYMTYPDKTEDPTITWCLSIPFVAIIAFLFSFIAVGHLVQVIGKIIKP